MTSNTISRRDFVKGAAMLAATVALGTAAVELAQPEIAKADTACNCNVYIASADLPTLVRIRIGLGNNAYMTNSAVPKNPITGPFPNSAEQSQNATYATNEDGSITVTVPLVNTGFTLTGYNDTSVNSITVEGVAQHATITGSTQTADGSRYDSLSVTMPTWGDWEFEATEYITVSGLPLSGNQTYHIHVLAASSYGA